MKSVWLLAWRYVAFHRLKTTLMVTALSVAVLFPSAITVLVGQFEARLRARALATPMLFGAKGNRFDLAMQALYFRADRVDAIPFRWREELTREGMAKAIPIHTRFTARGVTIVGTDADYFAFRKLRTAAGRFPGLLGEAVVGAEAAATLGIKPGDALLTDQDNIYDLSKSFPLKLRVVGVLAPSDSPDDQAVFVDTRTTWILEGIGHGHQSLAQQPEDNKEFVLKRDGKHVRANAALPTHVEITRENVASFHFHGDRGEFPITALIMLPDDHKGATILRARYADSKLVALHRPTEVIDDLLGIVFRVKRFFDANFIVVSISTGLFVMLVVMLSWRLRERERITLQKMGCSRGLIIQLQVVELMLVVGMASVVTAAVVGLTLILQPDMFRLLQ